MKDLHSFVAKQLLVLEAKVALNNSTRLLRVTIELKLKLALIFAVDLKSYLTFCLIYLLLYSMYIAVRHNEVS